MAQGKSVIKAASAAINTKAGRVLGMGISAGADEATLIIKDGGSSGTVKTSTLIVGTGTSDHWSFPSGIQCSTSIYATITGTTPVAMIEWED